jgi:outer membrane protein
MRVLLSMCVVCLLGSRAFADDTLTLPQVIAAAVRASPDFERASLDVKAAEGAALAAQGIEDTHVGANVSYQANRDGSGQIESTDHNRQLQGSLTIRKLLPTGTTLGLSLGSTWNFNRRITGQIAAQCLTDNPPPECASDTKPLEPVPFENTIYQTSGAFSITQPLLRGAGATAVEGPIRDARLQRDAAALQREAKARDLVVAIVEGYWQVALAKAERDVRQASLMLANDQLKFTEASIRASKIPESELLAVKQVIATRQVDLIAAEQQIYDRSVALRQLAGLEIGPNAIEVVTEALPAVDQKDIDMSAVVAAALERNPELAGLTASALAAQAGVDTANGLARSQLDVALSGGPIGIDTTQTDANGKVSHTPRFGDAVANLTDLKGYQVSASLTFDHAIEKRTERGTVAQARARLLRTKVDERAARARIASSATRAVQRARAALASVTLGDTAIALAQQNIENERKKLDVGKSTNFEVLRRQDELEAARLRRAGAVVDYLSARAEIDGLTGQILPRFGIVMH